MKKLGISGKMVIISAPSGAGKTTIVHHLLEQDLDLEFSISACSRKKRPDEVNGKDYYFFPVEEFKRKIDNNEFVEWEEVYPEHFYGTLHSEIDRIWDRGKHVIFDVDVIGGLNLKSRFKDIALALFVMPPSISELEKRLTGRSTDSEQNIHKRVEKATKEIKYANQFDIVVVNDKLDEALKCAENIVRKFLTSEV